MSAPRTNEKEQARVTMDAFSMLNERYSNALVMIQELQAERDALREQLNASAEQNVIARAERDALQERLSHAEAYIPSRDFADYLGDSGK